MRSLSWTVMAALSLGTSAQALGCALNAHVAICEHVLEHVRKNKLDFDFVGVPDLTASGATLVQRDAAGNLSSTAAKPAAGVAAGVAAQGKFRFQLDPESARIVQAHPALFRGGCGAPDAFPFFGNTDPSHSYGWDPVGQYDLWWQHAANDAEKAWVLGWGAHLMMDAAVHGFANTYAGRAMRKNAPKTYRDRIQLLSLRGKPLAGDPLGRPMVWETTVPSNCLTHVVAETWLNRHYVYAAQPAWETRAAQASDIGIGRIAIFAAIEESGIHRAPKDRNEALTATWFMAKIVDLTDLARGIVGLSAQLRARTSALRVIPAKDDSPAVSWAGGADAHHVLAGEVFTTDTEPPEHHVTVYLSRKMGDARFLRVVDGVEGPAPFAYRTRVAKAREVARGRPVVFAAIDDAGLHRAPKSREEALGATWFASRIVDVSQLEKGVVVVAGDMKIRVDALRLLPGKNGEACSVDAGSEGGACIGGSLAGLCGTLTQAEPGRKAKLGEKCRANEECEVGTCLGGVLGAEGVCTRPPQPPRKPRLGERCGVGEDCEEGRCTGRVGASPGFCMQPPAPRKAALGERCDANDDCAEGQCLGVVPAVSRGVCLQPQEARKAKLGERCRGSDECEAGACLGSVLGSQGVCMQSPEPPSRKLAKGVPCTTDSQCESARCAALGTLKLCR